jgi:hypothetical protein
MKRREWQPRSDSKDQWRERTIDGPSDGLDNLQPGRNQRNNCRFTNYRQRNVRLRGHVRANRSHHVLVPFTSPMTASVWIFTRGGLRKASEGTQPAEGQHQTKQHGN